jgi:periplasmic divalent cation tolerance protein
MAEIAMLYVTCTDHDEALRIARTLVDEKLIACANILAPHTAVYRWEGKVETGPETAMIMKTSSDKTARVTERIKRLHSYDVPCVVAWPVADGNPDFLTWVQDEVA